MNRKRVAIIIPSFDIGGAENMVSQLAINIDKEKFKVIVIVLSKKKNTSIENNVEENGIIIKYLNKELGINYKIIAHMYKILNEFKPDIVHTNLFSFAYAIPWILTHNVKMIHTVHNMPQYELSAKGKFLIDKLYKINKAIPVAISKIIENEMYKEYRFKNIETIYNPVDIKKFLNDRDYSEKENLVFVSVGRLVEQKNHELLIEAFKDVVYEFPRCKLKIIGDGKLRNKLEKKVKILNLENNIVFLGNITNIDSELKSSDIFVMSSNYEGLPLSILEAMASGLPIISTNVGGVPDIVKDNGILVEPGNSEILSNKMKRLCKKAEERKLLGLKSISNVSEFDIKNIAKKYEDIYLKYIYGE